MSSVEVTKNQPIYELIADSLVSSDYLMLEYHECACAESAKSFFFSPSQFFWFDFFFPRFLMRCSEWQPLKTDN